MKYLKDFELKNKKVLVRCDFNVPLDENQKITDDNRIKQSLPTIKFIIENGGMPILISHLGAPGGKVVPELSLNPVQERLKQLLQVPVQLASSCLGNEAIELAQKLTPNQVLLLENLRFQPNEKNNDPEFASHLAKLGDIYINDAFATAHRAHASIVGIPRYFREKGLGLLFQKEMEYYERSLLTPKRPLCVILGGSKVSTKLSALKNLADKADKFIIGGAMANTFLAAQGLQMGRSLFEPELFAKVLELLGSLARRDCKVYLPVDFMVGPSPSATGLARAVTSLEVPADTMALDIGPATSLLYKEALQTAETIIWNGPMGAFENEDYSKGTTGLIENLSSAHGLKVVGGGDTDAAIHQMELGHKFDYISTGGGAFLALLEGQSLPALDALHS
ncbi:MAG: phosphoglycerate kinase [Bdellovibrionales bacterium]|nr:phosphoglycerate kinase [Bdellovibrionales bacterium]